LRFIDASVFLYAYLTPKKRVPAQIEVYKKSARNILKRIEGGDEAVCTSLVHISEIANILGARTNIETTADILSGVLDLSNLKIVDPSTAMYEASVENSRSQNIGVNDALAYHIMKLEGITEIYSFDKDFDKLREVQRVQS
jgi:uncharacterized protein